MARPPRPVLLVWLLLASISVSLLVRASLAAPRGTAFVGTFFYVDDFYNYLSSVEQAQRGELVFRSKLASPTLPPALVNLEWLVAGWLAALMGGRAVLAFRVLGLLALGAWLFAADRFLVRSGLPDPETIRGEEPRAEREPTGTRNASTARPPISCTSHPPSSRFTSAGETWARPACS